MTKPTCERLWSDMARPSDVKSSEKTQEPMLLVAKTNKRFPVQSTCLEDKNKSELAA